MSEQKIETVLVDKHPDYDGELPARILASDMGIEIGLQGFQGGGYAPPDFGVPVFVELYEGKPQLLVWADANSEEPTHKIDLSGAYEPPGGPRKGWDPRTGRWRSRR